MNRDNKIRIPAQNRSIETKNQLMEAGKKLFSEKGYYKTNTKEIAREANVAIGSFYAYFKDKKDLFIAILNAYNENISQHLIIEDLFEKAKNYDKKDFIALLIKNVLKAHDNSPEFHRQINIMLHSDQEIWELYTRWDKEALNITKQLLTLWQDELRIDNLDAAAALIINTIENTVHLVKFNQVTINEDIFIDNLVDMIIRYLFND